MMRRLALSLLLVTGGCGLKRIDPCAGVNGACVALQIQGSGISRIDQAGIHATGSSLDAMQTAVSASGSLSLPVAVALVFDGVQAGSSLAVTIDVTGYASGNAVGFGETTANVSGGQHVGATVTLVGTFPDLGASDGNLDGGGIVVTPMSVKIGVGRRQKFSADAAVDWSVSEGASGGSVDASGMYSAPSAPGTYHVVATSQADPTQSATAVVTVAALELAVLAGQIGGPGTLDGVGADARFQGPEGVAVDTAGDVYIADTFNHDIRKLVVSTGTLTTIAGIPRVIGSTDGPGATAQFNFPIGVALDGAGNLFITDSENATIRQLALSTGQVSTLAGLAGSTGPTDGVGNAARFRRPNAIVADGAGNLYVADKENNVIRKIVIATRTVSTLAGSGVSGFANGTGTAAQFNAPVGIAIGPSGALFVGDTGNDAIRQVSLSGVVTTISGIAGMAGSADGTAATFNGPQFLAWDGGNGLYISDTGNATIRRYDFNALSVSTVAGAAGMRGYADGTGSAARFVQPFGLGMAASATLYIADSNYVIRRMSTSSTAVATVSGAAMITGGTDGVGTAARFQEPWSMVSDSAGNMYVADYANSTVRKVTPDGTVTTVAGTANATGSTDGVGSAARFYYPRGVALDGAGNLFVTDSINDTVRQIALATGTVTTLAGTAGMGGTTDGTGPAARFTSPGGITFDNGKLYVGDGSTIRMIDVSSAAVTTVAGKAGTPGSIDGVGAAARFSGPGALLADGTGDLYVTDGTTIRKVVIATAAVTTIAGMAGVTGSTDGPGGTALFTSPMSLALDGPNRLYIGDAHTFTVRAIALPSVTVTTFAGVSYQEGVRVGLLPASLNTPAGLSVLPSGDLAIVDLYEDAILTIRPH